MEALEREAGSPSRQREPKEIRYDRARSTYQHGVRLDFTRQGKPMDNPFIESFSDRLRDEHLNIELFFLVADARATLLEWQRDYNEVRPYRIVRVGPSLYTLASAPASPSCSSSSR